MSVLGGILFLALLLSASGSQGARKKRFPSSPGADPSLQFMVLGDWGGQPQPPYTTPAEVELAMVMGSMASKINSQFTLALGDNFYDTGVKDVGDKRFKETFEVNFV